LQTEVDPRKIQSGNRKARQKRSKGVLEKEAKRVEAKLHPEA
jgi:hypothetical protein